jgi:ankyrin repeat protein
MSARIHSQFVQAVSKWDEPTALALIDQGLTLATAPEGASSFLHMAMTQGLDNLALRLLEMGADPNAIDANGEIPLLSRLLRARTRPTIGTLHKLLGKCLALGMDPTRNNTTGQTILSALIGLYAHLPPQVLQSAVCPLCSKSEWLAIWLPPNNDMFLPSGAINTRLWAEANGVDLPSMIESCIRHPLLEKQTAISTGQPQPLRRF